MADPLPRKENPRIFYSEAEKNVLMPPKKKFRGHGAHWALWAHWALRPEVDLWGPGAHWALGPIWGGALAPEAEGRH